MDVRVNEQEIAVHKESWSMQGLGEMGLDRGDRRKSVERGWDRSLVSQVELLSRST
jgi:hypothetical protein